MTELTAYVKELSEVKAWLKQRIDEKVEPMASEIATTVDKAQKAFDEQRRENIKKLDPTRNMVVREGRFSGLNLMELAMAEGVFRGKRPLVKEQTFEHLRMARKALVSSIDYDALMGWEENSVRKALSGYGDNRGTGVLRDSLASWRAQLYQGVTRALDSTTAASGDELVATMEAAELWMDVNLETKVLPLFIQSPMPTNPFDIPAQLGDVNWYPTTENEAGVTTTVATAKTTLTAYGLKAGIPFSDELEEDAIIALLPELRRNLARNSAEIIDDILLNADTTAANNINNDGVTTSKSTAGKAHFLIGFDGLIHLAYVDNTAQRTRHASTITAAMYNTNLIKMARFAAPGRRGDVVHISDINTALKALTMDEVETMEKLGTRATISSGELTSIYGVPYIMSEQMLLADTTGAVRNATANNTTGRVLTVNTTQWRTGFRRQVMFEPDREPGKSQTTLYVSFRIAFTERSGTRSSAKHTALTYDISSVT